MSDARNGKGYYFFSTHLNEQQGSLRNEQCINHTILFSTCFYQNQCRTIKGSGRGNVNYNAERGECEVRDLLYEVVAICAKLSLIKVVEVQILHIRSEI